MTRPLLPLTALAVTLLAGCGGTAPSDSTGVVCDEFAGYVQDGQPADTRADTVRSMGEVVGNADQAVQDAHATLEQTATGSDTAWATAADGFAQACFDAGWEG